MRIAINGFGRIGRSFFRIAFANSDLDIVAINDLGNLENLAYLLQYDTVYRRYPLQVRVQLPDKLIVEGKEILFFQERNPVKLPWQKLAIDVVIEATGVFTEYSAAQKHLEAGAKKVIITAPAKGEEGKEGRTVLLGINEEETKEYSIISNGSCTTNAVSPALAVLDKEIGIKKAILNTIHAFTSTQRTVDGPQVKDWRRGRSASQNIIPSTTGAAKTVIKVLPELKNKFDGIALRVPVVCGSIADITFVSARPTSVSEINDIFRKASHSSTWRGILGVTEKPVVSSDIIQDPRPAIVDLTFTRVVDKDLVKVLVWYDNEWAYSWTLVQQVKNLA